MEEEKDVRIQDRGKKHAMRRDAWDGIPRKGPDDLWEHH